jgi:Tol biopolymer transport system component
MDKWTTRGTVLAGLLAGCGTTVTPDAPDAAGVDAAIDSSGLACDLTQPFGNIREVDGLNTADDEGSPSFSPDELTVYFFSNRQSPGSADNDAYVATRATRDSAFGIAAPFAVINSGADERGGYLAADQLSLFYHSSGGASYDLYVTTRANTGAVFDPPVPLGAGVNTDAIESDPYITPDGETLYFGRDDGTAGGIFRASAGPTGFGTATAVSELNGAYAGSPVLSADGTTIFFISDRAGGVGGVDIWTATRAAATGTFGAITNVTELNSTDFEHPSWLSADGCRIYFTSRRAGASGGHDIWVADRPQ